MAFPMITTVMMIFNHGGDDHGCDDGHEDGDDENDHDQAGMMIIMTMSSGGWLDGNCHLNTSQWYCMCKKSL